MKRILIFISIMSVQIFYAQDLHFSQFNEQPSLVNPALTGVRAPMRAAICYRDQWRSVTSPYRTMGASFERRLKASNWEQVDEFRTMTFKQRSLSRLAGGLSVYKDNAGDGNLGLTQANLSLATFVPLNTKSFLSVGMQAGLVQCRIDKSKLVFPDQYNGLYYDANQISNEDLMRMNYTYGDLAAGALWSYGQNEHDQPGKKQLKANVGVAVYHFNKGKQGYISIDKDARFYKYVAHGDMLASFSNTDYALAPSFIFQSRGTTNELIAGLMLNRYIKMNSKYTGVVKRSRIGVGGYFRNKDAAIICLAFERKEQFAIGMSYDLNLSKLVVGTSSRGGVELTLTYTPPNAFLYQKKEAKK